MTNFDYVQKTIDLFEDSLKTGPPTTQAGVLAERIGYSTHHLGRLFQSLCGEPLGRYMQKRRLAEAVSLIRDNGITASETALRLGWEDYSAFSRAVKKEFGISPGQIAKAPPESLPLTVRARPSLKDSGKSEILEPIVIRVPPFHVTGMVFFMGPNEKTFHKPWRIFERNRDKIAGGISRDTWQFSTWEENSPAVDQGIWIHCAMETDPAVPQIPLFFSRLIPEQNILRFIHQGSVEHLYQTYRLIWNDYLPGSTFKLVGHQEYQHYSGERDQWQISICLPIEPEW